jgi:hypothetical protein
VRPIVSSGARGGYEAALADVWSGLSRALAELEWLAAEPEERLGEESLATLGRLQYVLHSASELALGIDPPPGSELAHDELAAALADAREATGEIAEALDAEGWYGLEPHLPEWRGALFRVRLARLRVATPRPLPAIEREPEPAFPREALAASVCSILGAAAFAAGAVLAAWPLWVIGLTVFTVGLAVYRPRP